MAIQGGFLSSLSQFNCLQFCRDSFAYENCSSISDEYNEFADGISEEISCKNVIKESHVTQNKLIVDKGRARPENIFHFLGVRTRTSRQRSITVTPFRSQNKLKNKAAEISASNTNGITKREDNTFHLAKEDSKGFKPLNLAMRVDQDKISGPSHFDLSKRENKPRNATSTLKRKITLKESQMYDSGKLIKLLHPEEK